MELMTVLALIGIVASLAVPLYSQYVARSQSTRVMAELAHLRARVEECISAGIDVVGDGSQQCDMGGFQTDLVRELIAELDVGAHAIRAVLGVNAALPIAGRELVWVRSSAGTWYCQTNVDSQYRPSGCTAMN